jgi:3-deoxy-7-phosphoheptulonate synthase
MIIMEADATQEQIDFVVAEIKRFGLRADVSRGEYKTVIGLIGDEKTIPFSHFEALPGVKEAIQIEVPYKLISREYNDVARETSKPMVIEIGEVAIGGNGPVFMAGPCAIEGKEQLFRIAEKVKEAGAHILRGGVFKPRTSVHSFQGLGAESMEKAEEALKWLYEAGRKYGMPVVTEVRGEAYVDLLAEYADILQIGARNMYDQDLLISVARKGKPVLFKRHFGASIEEFLSYAEYIAAEGNNRIILCERGIMPMGKGKAYTRYTLDLAAVPVIQRETYLPVIVDPSHATGRRELVFNMSCAGIAAGARGLIVEVHTAPSEALVDGRQMILPEELKDIISVCNHIARITTGAVALGK